MTIRELVSDIIEGNPVGGIMLALTILRSVAQGEPATLEGCEASTLMWIDFYGKPTGDSIRRWLDDIGHLSTLDIPERVVQRALDALELDMEDE